MLRQTIRHALISTVLTALVNPPRASVRILHLVDDEPAEPAEVTAEAARRLVKRAVATVRVEALATVD